MCTVVSHSCPPGCQRYQVVSVTRESLRHTVGASTGSFAISSHRNSKGQPLSAVSNLASGCRKRRRGGTVMMRLLKYFCGLEEAEPKGRPSQASWRMSSAIIHLQCTIHVLSRAVTLTADFVSRFWRLACRLVMALRLRIGGEVALWGAPNRISALLEQGRNPRLSQTIPDNPRIRPSSQFMPILMRLKVAPRHSN
jgi:hypothetical protein